MKDLGDLTFFLRMAIYQDPLMKAISLSQKAYLMRVLDHFGMTNCNPHYTLLPSGMVLTSNMSLKNDVEHMFVNN